MTDETLEKPSQGTKGKSKITKPKIKEKKKRKKANKEAESDKFQVLVAVASALQTPDKKFRNTTLPTPPPVQQNSTPIAAEPKPKPSDEKSHSFIPQAIADQITSKPTKLLIKYYSTKKIENEKLLLEECRASFSEFLQANLNTFNTYPILNSQLLLLIQSKHDNWSEYSGFLNSVISVINKNPKDFFDKKSQGEIGALIVKDFKSYLTELSEACAKLHKLLHSPSPTFQSAPILSDFFKPQPISISESKKAEHKIPQDQSTPQNETDLCHYVKSCMDFCLKENPSAPDSVPGLSALLNEITTKCDTIHSWPTLKAEIERISSLIGSLPKSSNTQLIDLIIFSLALAIQINDLNFEKISGKTLAFS